ncbi:MAG: ABC transporter permease [Haloplanus sp.]
MTRPGADANLSARFGRPLIVGLLVLTTVFLIGPVIATFVSSFASEWTGVLPTGFFTLTHWKQALGLTSNIGNNRGFGAGLQYSVLLALGGVFINLLVGIPIAYAIVRYDFPGKDLLSTFAVLPLVPGLILGIAFLRTYPELSGSGIALVIGYSLLKAPFMIVAVKSSFETMDLRRIEESARSLGASWPRTFLTLIVPNAKEGIIAGSIICWTLAAAEFNFSYIVYSRGARPFSLFLFANISNSTILSAAAAVSIYFLIVAVVTALLRATGTRGFTYGG